MLVLITFSRLCDKRYAGYDDRFRGIFNTRHLDFKKQWVQTLPGIVTYTEGLYSDDKDKWNQFLERRGIDWADIRSKLLAAEAQVQRENASAKTKAAVAGISHKTQRGRGMFGKYATSDLAEPHALARMRGLLREV